MTYQHIIDRDQPASELAGLCCVEKAMDIAIQKVGASIYRDLDPKYAERIFRGKLFARMAKSQDLGDLVAAAVRLQQGGVFKIRDEAENGASDLLDAVQALIAAHCEGYEQ